MEIGEIYLKDISEISLRKENLAENYVGLYRIFQEVLKERTQESRLDFSGAFARMDYLCKQLHYAEEEYRRINSFRACSKEIQNGHTDKLSESCWLDDLKTLTEFVSRVYHVEIPDELACRLPQVYLNRQSVRPLTETYIRLIVDNWDEQYIYGKTADESTEFIRVDYATANFFGDWTYLKDFLTPHTQLNLVHPRKQENTYFPELIIYEPDFLLDISAIASCFEPYGCTPLTYLVNKIKPAANTRAILLGNFASQLLDEAIYCHKGEAPSYKESARRFFQRNVLHLITCKDMDATFHTDAMNQQRILQEMIREQFPEVSGIDMEKIVLEPSFYCEMLGIQGRMDLLQEDMRVLMEQKSGKRAFQTGKHVEKHYVQMLLYLALLHYNYRLRNDEISCFLLYSKYRDGLLKETTAPELLAEAIRLRNSIVRQELLYGEGKAEEIFEHLSPADLNVNRVGGTLWERYTEPQLRALLRPIHVASRLERNYFYRFFTFVEKEHILSKLGNARKEGSGFASIWNDTLDEKQQSGNIYDRLQIVSKEYNESENGGIELVTLEIPMQEDNCILPNFRVGDIAILYAYPMEKVPDVRKTAVLRCSVKALTPQRITVKLRAPQKNEHLFVRPENYRWAIEHDFVESSFSTLYRGLYAFLSATEERRALLLNQRVPQVNPALRLKGDYSCGGASPEFNDLVLKAKQAQDYFLLIGPPGTGKTSFGLVNILKEALMEEGQSILLVSYTNRAVDEICSKLVKHHIDFIRIGSGVSCDEAYQPYLLENKVNVCSNASAIRELIARTRVFVGTTTALSGNIHLFGIKHFDLAIVDEASQILEPHLLPLLSARVEDGRDAIRKFILVGDQKQLPAVVMQSDAESEVSDPLLRKYAGLTNCRLSLFERLLTLRRGDDWLVYCMEKQGRMHPEVSQFPNVAFYQTRLRPVPLEHQCHALDFPVHAGEGLESMLATRRLLFFPSDYPPPSHSIKVNHPEARLIAEIVHVFWKLYRKNGKPFSSEQTLGIIVPYRNQIALIRKEIARFAIPELNQITIDTVERYQGSEREVIIYGFTIQKPYQLAFLTENAYEEEGKIIDRKLNVALTRAREQLILVGNPDLLNQNEIFRKLITYVNSLS